MFTMLFVCFAAWHFVTSSAETIPANSPCADALKKHGKPDATLTAKHLARNCPELCVSAANDRRATGQFSHPYDCNAYITCASNDAWIHWCQKGLEFNEKISACDWPASSGCSKRGWPTPAPVVTTTTTSKPSKLIVQIPRTTCQENDPFVIIYEYLGIRPDLCTDGTGFYPAPDCRFYIRCNGTEASAAKCPAGFIFDRENRRCDWPQKNAECLELCTGSGNVVISERTTPAPSTSTTTATPINVTPAKLIEAPRTTTTATPSTTTKPTTTRPTTTTTTEPPHDPLCPEIEGNFEYPKDCKKYVTCEKWHAVLHGCPVGLVYVDSRKWCDWTWLLPNTHECYKPFDDGTGDCPFYRGTGNETYASTTETPLTTLRTSIY